MAGSLEAIERLINEADSKFEDKLKHAQSGHTANLTVYADRTYNLRQQIAHNASLTNDDHFMDLLLHTEKYLSPEYQVRGEVDKKLTALLAGLLKTLLRETVAITSFASRKIQIEMIWQWYQDKQKQILDFSLARMDERIAAEKAARGESSAAVGSADHQGRTNNESSTRNVLEGGEGHSSGKVAGSERTVKRKFLGYNAEKFGVKPVNEGQVSSARPLTFTEEAARESESHHITKKMGLYRKRNLSKAEKLRQEIAQRNSAVGPSEGGPRVVYTKDAQSKRAPQQERPATHHGGHNGVSGPSPLLHRGPLIDSDPETRRLDAAVVASQKHWVKGMIQKVEEANEKREMKDVLTTLAFNQARIEEESSRRLESEQHASQAGRSCHTILRREPRTKDGEEAVTTQSKQPSASLTREETLKLLGIATFDSSDSTSTSLSPYDDYKPTSMDEAKLQKLLSRVRLPEQPQQEQAMMMGKIKPTHPRNMAGTPAMNVGLDVQSTVDTKVSAQVPRSDVPLIEQLFPVLQQEEDVPSLARMEEIRLVERIRECLGRAKTKKGDGFHVPRKEIEMAILTPDDRPREECFKLLPRPSSAFPKNPWLALEGKGKKKGGKGKKKKEK